MENLHISIKKRLLISLAFLSFFVMVLFLGGIVKNKKTSPGTTPVVPTKIPIQAQQGAPPSLSTPIVKTAPTTTSNNLGAIVFSLPKVAIPASATLYEQSPTIIPADTISKLQSRLLPGGDEKILDTPQGQVILMSGDGKTLLFYLYSRTVVYTNAPSNNKSIESTELLTKKAVDFIHSLSLSVDSASYQIKYFSNRTGDLVETKNIDMATTIDVSFRELIHGLVVFRQYGNDSRTHVWFSKNGDIIKFTYFYSPLYTPKTSISIPTLEEAKSNILNNKGIIVELGNEYQQSSLGDPTSTTFTSASVGYFNDIENEMLYPIFVFEGTTVIKNVKYPIAVYLPITN